MDKASRYVSVVYERKINIEQIKKFTQLLRVNSDLEEVRINGQKVSGNAFNLVCDFISGYEVKLTNLEAEEIKYLGKKLECLPLLNLVRRSNLQLRIESEIDKMRRMLVDYKYDIELMKKFIEINMRDKKDVLKNEETVTMPLICGSLSNIPLLMDDLESLKQELELDPIYDEVVFNSADFSKILMSDTEDIFNELILRSMCPDACDHQKLYMEMTEYRRLVRDNNGLRVPRIQGNRFYQIISQLVDIVIPANILEIDISAFEDCMNLKRIRFDEHSRIRCLEARWFSSRSLSEIMIPTSVETISDECFYSCSSLAKITFASGSRLKKIGKDAFCCCGKLKEIKIPSSVEVICECCFYKCSALARITFEEGSRLVSIQNDVFSECHSLSEIEIPASVEYIGERCFIHCSSLSRVSFPRESHLERIDKAAFFDCKNLNEIEIPAKVQFVGERCFCRSISSRVTFAQGSYIKRLDREAFSECSLREIEIPAGVEVIGEKCFCQCIDLRCVRFCQDCCLKIIESDAFAECSSLQKIEIPIGVRIEPNVFRGCGIAGITCFNCPVYSLTDSLNPGEITIPAHIEILCSSCFKGSTLSRVMFEKDSCIRMIENEAFSQCNNLEMVELPAKLEFIGEACFFGCSALCNVVFASGSRLKRIEKMAFMDANLDEIRLPAALEVIEQMCFCECSFLRRVTFENGSCLKRIESNAFAECCSLEEMDIPKGVHIVEHAFIESGVIGIMSRPGNSLYRANIWNARVIEIPPDVQILCGSCFRCCSSLTRVTFAKGSCVKRIEKEAFFQCSNLEEIEIPASVEVIEDDCFGGRWIGNAFHGCSSLRRVTFASGSQLKKIGNRAFIGCTKLNEIEIPASVEVIGESWFSGSSFSRVTFASDSLLQKIEREAFFKCMNLKEIVIPLGVEVIGESCFRFCRLISRVHFMGNSRLKRIEKEAFFHCRSLREVTIPAGVEVIEESCFSCSSLAHVTFASGSCLQRIDKKAFFGCINIREFNVPAAVEFIGEECFSKCTSLFSVTFPSGSSLKKVEKDAFSNCQLTELEVPATAVIYQTESLSIKRR